MERSQHGRRQERTEWHRVVFFGRLAEVVEEYLKKGSQVYIEGSLRTRKWKDQNDQDRWTTEIIASDMQMLGSRSTGSHADAGERDMSSGTQEVNSAGEGASTNDPNLDDDIPF